MGYDFGKIEPKWQKYWEKEGVFKANDSASPKEYVLDFFPYPSGAGLHVGHPKGYVATDVYSRYKRLTGVEVLHPIGWDAFGLPAENYAIKKGIHPEESTATNIEYFTKQLKQIGLSYDWSREINTSKPEYYKWTQWLFLQMFENDLAYRKEAMINWCNNCHTGLANEQVIDGRCERCDELVIQKPLEQWFFRITKYADELLDDLDKIELPERVRLMQTNWIGRSEGSQMTFELDGGESVDVFTTRPDTLMGVTYVVLAPEHELVEKITTDEQRKEVDSYIKATKKRTELERSEEGDERTGVFTGGYAKHPVSGEKVPVWIADYVLYSYGTGAVMGVPAHDERDYDFATHHSLPIQWVVAKKVEHAKSFLMGAGDISDDALESIGVEIVERTEDGNRKILIPRNSLKKYEALIDEKMMPGFWNEYIADNVIFLFKDNNGMIQRFELDRENEKEINRLAEEYTSDGWEADSTVTSWLADNDWYTDYLIHTEIGVLVNSGEFNGMESEKAKKAITKKAGGEITVQYRLRDWLISRQRYWGAPIPIIYCEKCGLVPVPEDQLPVRLPQDVEFKPTGESPLADSEEFVNTTCPNCDGAAKREVDTMDTFMDSSWYYLRFTDPHNQDVFAAKDRIHEWNPIDVYVGGAEHAVMHLLYVRFFAKVLNDLGYVNFREPFKALKSLGLVLGPDGLKMSKSKGNVINPDDVIAQYGADTFRMYEMFMGPFEDEIPWDPKSIVGVHRFLFKVWGLEEAVGDVEDSEEVQRALAKTVTKVGEDISAFKFNTAVSTMMEFVNIATKQEKISGQTWESLLTVLYPFAPHMCEELWERRKGKGAGSLQKASWPTVDEALLVETEIQLVVQVNGKLRDTLEVAAGLSEDEAIKTALASENVKKFLEDKDPKKVIFVPDKLINFVV